MINVYDLLEFAPNFFQIADKSGQLIPFTLNRAQRYVHERIEEQLKRLGYVRLNILKGRQQGLSTYIQARFFHKVLMIPGTNAFILTHMTDATRSLFAMTKRYNNNLPKGLAPTADKDNDNQLLFNKLNSGYRVGTAGSKEIGRSMTNQLMHMSEYAFYEKPAEIKRGIEQTVADIKGTEKIKESTANGVNNAFYVDWVNARDGKLLDNGTIERSDWENIFIPWYWQDEYTRSAQGFILTDEEKDWMELYAQDGLTINHLAWRRNKLADFDGDYDQKCKGFKQEYPFTDEEAFISSITDTFISVDCVQAARKHKIQTDMPLIIGVDPSLGQEASDDTAIAYRRGRSCYKIDKYRGLGTRELAWKLKEIIDRERPDKVFVDCIGIGADLAPTLNEMGYSNVIGINVAKNAKNKDKFKNTRAELWAETRDWLTGEEDVQIPDSAELQKELCCFGYKWPGGKLLIESKDDVKARGMRSPNMADALVLTFAYGQYAGSNSYQVNRMSEKSYGMFT